jgi:pimeloyl-ACP methyl ester carboxylesterase
VFNDRATTQDLGSPRRYRRPYDCLSCTPRASQRDIRGIGPVADHFDKIVRGLKKKPAIIGHSFGGLLTQILAPTYMSRADARFATCDVRSLWSQIVPRNA